MALSDAERQRRARRHRTGDHSLCDPKRDCTSRAEPADRLGQLLPLVAAGSRFGPRGQALWEAMEAAALGPAHRVLLVEACRMADRLDALDRLLSGDSWFVEQESDGRVVLVADAALSEARQYASALKALVAQLEDRPKPAVSPGSRKHRDAGIGDLTARIAARRSQSPGC